MIDLKTTTGLDVQFNGDRRKIIVSDNVIVSAIANKSLKQMQSVIINDNLVCPEIFYTIYAHMFRRKDENYWLKSDLIYDLTFILPNLAGIEFIKTFGHYNDINKTNKYGMAEIIEVAYGSGVVIMQRPKQVKEYKKDFTIDDIYDFERLQEVHIVKVAKGDKLIVPPGFAYTVINTKSQLLAIGTLSSQKRRPICEPIYRLHGAAYYLIRKNAKQEIVKNPNYKELPKIKKSKPADFNKLFNFKSLQPLYVQALKNPERFDWLKDTNGYNM